MMFFPKGLLMIQLSGLYNTNTKSWKIIGDFSSKALTKNLLERFTFRDLFDEVTFRRVRHVVTEIPRYVYRKNGTRITKEEHLLFCHRNRVNSSPLLPHGDH
jgi:hypothetical protein